MHPESAWDYNKSAPQAKFIVARMNPTIRLSIRNPQLKFPWLATLTVPNLLPGN